MLLGVSLKLPSSPAGLLNESSIHTMSLVMSGMVGESTSSVTSHERRVLPFDLCSHPGLATLDEIHLQYLVGANIANHETFCTSAIL
jgi:hypothetical protein